VRYGPAMTKTLALALAAAALFAPAADAGVCKYYKVYNPANGQVYTYDLTWCAPL